MMPQSDERASGTMPPRQLVVLVHGIFDTSRVFGTMSHYLAQHGWQPYACSLTPNNGDKGIDELALQLHDYIEHQLPAGERFDLIGFSMGGLISRYYLQRLGGIERVRQFITLSAPHNGSLLAYLLNNPGCKQMRPGSAFLKALNSDAEMLDRVGFVSIWTPWDLTIVPARSSRLAVGTSIQVAVPMHPLMLESRRSLDQIVRALGSPEPSDSSQSKEQAGHA